MASFVNTVDEIGDEALTASIIARSITKYCDNVVTTIGQSAFEGCAALTVVDIPSATKLAVSAFGKCSSLETLILRGESMCALAHTGALLSTPIASGTGYIYVPSALVDTYKAATNWRTYANQFRALEDYTVDGVNIPARDYAVERGK